MASPDGHRWALAADALGRCQAVGYGDLHLRVLKVIALVDWLKDRSGLVASVDVLKRALPGCGNKKLAAALADLQGSSLIVFRKFAHAYAIFEGSDFDIDRAVEEAASGMDGPSFGLGQRAGGPATHRGKAPLSRDGGVALVRCQHCPLSGCGRSCCWLCASPWRHWRLLSCDPDARGVGRRGEEDLPESPHGCLVNGISSSVCHKAPGTFQVWPRSCRDWSAYATRRPTCVATELHEPKSSPASRHCRASLKVNWDAHPPARTGTASRPGPNRS